MMPPEEAYLERKKIMRRHYREKEEALELERAKSQLLTRGAVVRDIVVKRLIKSLQRDGVPAFFPTPGFDIYIGKVTDLFAVHPDFLFPDKYIVPKDSPEESFERFSNSILFRDRGVSTVSRRLAARVGVLTPMSRTGFHLNVRPAPSRQLPDTCTDGQTLQHELVKRAESSFRSISIMRLLSRKVLGCFNLQNRVSAVSHNLCF